MERRCKYKHQIKILAQNWVKLFLLKKIHIISFKRLPIVIILISRAYFLDFPQKKCYNDNN